MKKIRKLQEAIERGDLAEASALADELYNVTRDFSQCVQMEKDEHGNLVFNSKCGGADYAIETKRKIVEWVGGH